MRIIKTYKELNDLDPDTVLLTTGNNPEEYELYFAFRATSLDLPAAIIADSEDVLIAMDEIDEEG